MCVIYPMGLFQELKSAMTPPKKTQINTSKQKTHSLRFWWANINAMILVSIKGSLYKSRVTCLKTTNLPPRGWNYWMRRQSARRGVNRDTHFKHLLGNAAGVCFGRGVDGFLGWLNKWCKGYFSRKDVRGRSRLSIVQEFRDEIEDERRCCLHSTQN